MTCSSDAAALLGVWAMGACSEAESEAVMSHIARCPQCAAEAARLRHAANALAGGPSALRGRTLARARARRPAAPSVPPFAAPYAAQVSGLDALLTELADGDWTRMVVADE